MGTKSMFSKIEKPADKAIQAGEIEQSKSIAVDMSIVFELPAAA